VVCDVALEEPDTADGIAPGFAFNSSFIYHQDSRG
jgi:hypothetical protein